ncbi:NDR1/HIN1-like protein 13 [Gastrolobium bilobum]|uniref:NDR1/HIN1-like protein 13 n=1 Tax=Gastrolobium bilobum TaxID=150636 RepID=UPI002AB2AD0F|nr:NDR1/HIN1-like protein 13 [Gastrolobium bilobum]
MEGRAPQNGTSEVKDVDRTASSETVPALPPPPGHARNEMYIIQFPKDQVYRVPPRENALIMERYRKPPDVKRSNGSCCCGSRLLLTIALILVSIIAILGITFAILFFIFNPTAPSFSVTDVVVVKPGPGNRNPRPQYQIGLRARNPNERLGIEYEKAEVSLLFEEKKVATGMFPMLEQGRDSSKQVKVELTGSNGPLPKEKANTRVALDLDMKLGMRIEAAGLKSWVMKSHVMCKVEVNSLVNNTRVLSQECDAKFKQY